MYASVLLDGKSRKTLFSTSFYTVQLTGSKIVLDVNNKLKEIQTFIDRNKTLFIIF